MDLLVAALAGLLFAAGTWLLSRRSAVRLVLGLGLLGHAANLLVFVSGGLLRGRPPLVAEGLLEPVPPVADPLPQALVLTSIVIGFGVQVFALVLVLRAATTFHTDDLDAMRAEVE